MENSSQNIRGYTRIFSRCSSAFKIAQISRCERAYDEKLTKPDVIGWITHTPTRPRCIWESLFSDLRLAFIANSSVDGRRSYIPFLLLQRQRGTVTSHGDSHLPVLKNRLKTFLFPCHSIIMLDISLSWLQAPLSRAYSGPCNSFNWLFRPL